MSAKEFLDKSIKDIISEYPQVEKILDEFGIGCGSCAEGICLLKEIVDVHNIDPEDENNMHAKIAAVLSPEGKIEFPKSKRKKLESTEIKYSPPMKKLVDEHVWIKRWLALIPNIIDRLNLDDHESKQELIDGLDFIRNYADKYHHAKEEDELFKYFDENLDILKVIKTDHLKVRAHVKEILRGIELSDLNLITSHLLAYKDLLPEHIKKEDEILYPWMDRNFSTTQIGEIFSKFNEIDEDYADAPENHEKFILKLEKKYT